MLEFFEYVIETSGEIQLSKYRFHWQDAQGNLKKRWDNAPHHLELPNLGIFKYTPRPATLRVAEVIPK